MSDKQPKKWGRLVRIVSRPSMRELYGTARFEMRKGTNKATGRVELRFIPLPEEDKDGR